MVAPSTPVIVSHPDQVTLLRSATFEFVVVDDSPGLSTFNYSLVDGLGRPVVSVPPPPLCEGWNMPTRAVKCVVVSLLGYSEGSAVLEEHSVLCATTGRGGGKGYC